MFLVFNLRIPVTMWAYECNYEQLNMVNYHKTEFFAFSVLLYVFMQSAAALCIGVGSFSDPAEVPGLAHFLEHSMFH